MVKDTNFSKGAWGILAAKRSVSSTEAKELEEKFEEQVSLLNKVNGIELIRIAYILLTKKLPVLKWELHSKGAKLLVMAVKVLFSSCRKARLYKPEAMVDWIGKQVKEIIGGLRAPIRELLIDLFTKLLDKLPSPTHDLNKGSTVRCVTTKFPEGSQFLRTNFGELEEHYEEIFRNEIQEFVKYIFYGNIPMIPTSLRKNCKTSGKICSYRPLPPPGFSVRRIVGETTSRGSVVAPLQVPEVRLHKYIVKRTGKPTWCDYCGKFIWTRFNGFYCECECS